MNDTMVTVVGNVATDLMFRETQGGAVARFRLAVTARRWHREEQRWVDGHTNFFSVATWRYLAHNVSSSVAIGDPVVVHGRLRLRDEVYEGQRRLTAEIEAVSVGHDLARGTTAFRRPPRDDARSSAAATVVARERRYGPASWGPAADAAGAMGAADTGTDLGGAATRGPARVGDVVDELFLRQGATSGGEGAVAAPGGASSAASGGAHDGENGQEARSPAARQLTLTAPTHTPAPASTSAPAAVASAPAEHPAPVPPPTSPPPPPPPPPPATKQAVPWVTTPPAPDGEPGVKAASRRKSTKVTGPAPSGPGTAPSVPGEPEPTAATAARPARRTVAKRRVRGTEGKPAPGPEAGTGTGRGAEAMAEVREAVPVGASLGDPDAVPPF
ncbi:single-stranded DNA-binding protein [Streptomyces sp. NPDC088923]|uniref:single-stranded DNA-binding protein n=1 Tax=Streptomyces sp. NPDC088923 TaxID=3365913 RepID=UPI003812541F